MIVGVPKEVHPDERRVASSPRTVHRLIKMGFEVIVEEGAGTAAEFADAEYIETGASLVSAPEVWERADIILKVREPQMHPALQKHEADMLRESACLICFIWPAQNKDLLEKFAASKASVLAMDCIPRITRAQSMDALSAMANVAGYRAVIEAGFAYPRLFSGQVTAAGKVAPAKVLVIGGGVAGLAAIGAARGLGAQVRAFDTRPEVREQVQSMGAEFLDFEFEFDESGAGEGGYAKKMSDAFLEAERALFAKHAMEVDIIITTALIPGVEAPKLITQGMVQSMREGAVIVDLAAQQGGNCTLTEPGKLVMRHGVRIVGYTDLASRMAIQTSWLYGSTLVNLLEEMGGGENFQIDLENEIVRGALVAHDGQITWPPPKVEKSLKPIEKARQTNEETPEEHLWTEKEHAPDGSQLPKRDLKQLSGLMWLLVIGFVLLGIGAIAPESFLRHLTVFILACLVGWLVVWSVKPALHTPLMSVTNAISGIIVIGGLLQLAGPALGAASVLGAVAVFIATINIVGGFLVTRRMLAMFHK